MSTIQQPPFAFDIGETVDVMITGRVVERIQTKHGISYLIEQQLKTGSTALQRAKQEHVYPHEEGEV